VIRVDLVGQFAFEAQEDGAVGAVTATGMTQRAEELGADPDRGFEDIGFAQAVEKDACGAHRSDRVRTRGSDPDLEQVENADGHGGLRAWIREPSIMPLDPIK
jgi:hypothetical protein